MLHPRPHLDSRLKTLAIALAASSALLLSACTTYRPLDRGATVPWARALASAKQEGPMDGNRYRVGEGDALSSIADQYNVRMVTLAAANNIEPPYVLYPGEVLRIPEDAPLPTRRPEIIQTKLEPSLPAESVPEKPLWDRRATAEPKIEGERYTVVSGDSLGLIAAKRGLTLGDLVAVNELEAPYQIQPGQILIIPPSEASLKDEVRRESQTADRRTEPMTPPPPLSGEGFLWPVEGELIGSFGQNGTNGRSGGVNIAARKGAPVRASDNGIVAYAGEAVSGYGRLVMLRHAEGYVTLYAHNDVILVREGDVVRRGQAIAEVGDSGDVDESQLHFELRKGTAPLDPTKVLAGLPVRQIGSL